MFAYILLLISLFLPVVSVPQPTATPVVDPAPVQYVGEVRTVGGAYLTVAAQLGNGLNALAANPLLIRDPAFIASIRQLTATMRFLRLRLDATPSPAAVEQVHRSLEQAGDLFVLASLKLDRFAERHNFDDLADGYELIVAGTGLWLLTMQQLPTSPTELQAQAVGP